MWKGRRKKGQSRGERRVVVREGKEEEEEVVVEAVKRQLPYEEIVAPSGSGN